MELLRPDARKALFENRGDNDGTRGRDWVRRLPGLVASAATRWSLTLEPHYDNLSYNYVAPVRTKSGDPAVLKLVAPYDTEALLEAEALRAFDGAGAARLIKADRSLGASLIERLEPGLAVWSLQDDVTETATTSEVIRSIRRAPPPEHPFPTMRRQFENTIEKNGAHERRPAWFVAGIDFAMDLLADPPGPQLLLHGDLHHNNILSSQRGWLAIDPHGVIAEAEWEIGAYLYNHLPDGDTESAWRRLVRRRADQLSEALDLDRAHAHACAAAYAVLSLAWSLENGAVPPRGIRRMIAANELAGIPY